MPSELSGLVGGRARQSERRGLAVAAAALAVIALAGIALAALLAPAAPRTIKQVAPKPVQYVKAAPLARKAKGHPQQAVRYVKAQGHPQQAVRYVKVPAHYIEERVRAPPRRVEKRIVHGKVEYVMVPAQMHRGRRGLRRQELRIGAKGVRRGVMLDDEEEPAEGDEEEAPAEDGEGEAEEGEEGEGEEGEGEEGEGEEGEGEEEGDAEEAADEAPAAVTPPTPEEIAKALQRIQERQIQEQTFHDTLVDAQTGQPLHVPGVAGSAHNGVSGIGGIFGVGGFLGPDYPISDSMQPAGAVSSGPACTCTSCTGSPPVCTGCTCR